MTVQVGPQVTTLTRRPADHVNAPALDAATDVMLAEYARELGDSIFPPLARKITAKVIATYQAVVAEKASAR